jgi:hypothetical protein
MTDIKVELEFQSGVLKESDREEIRASLREGVVNITFTKVDGTERTMRCTLLSDLIPVDEQQTKKDNERKFTDDAIRVWDSEKQAWRAFRWNSVKKVEQVVKIPV